MSRRNAASVGPDSVLDVDAAIEATIRNIRKIPNRYRAYTEDVDKATKIHQVDEELMKSLIDCGLPYVRQDGQYWFDRTDLENIGLSLRLPCPRYSGMRWWSRALEMMKTDQVTRYDLKIAAKCPESGHEGDCQFSMTPQLEAAAVPGSTRVTGPGSFLAQVDVNAAERFFEGAHAELFELLETLDFHMLPYLTPLTPEFADETGLADCRITARILLREAAARGLTARPASGYFMAAPFPMKHTWIQFEIDGEWVSADPFLLKTFATWGIVDPQVWPQHRSLHGILWPIESKTSVESSIVKHGDTVVETSVTIARREAVA